MQHDTHSKKRKILITSIGTGVGNALLTAVRKSEHTYVVIGLNTEPFHSGVYRADVSYMVPLASADPKGWMERLLEVIRIEGPLLVIPARDADLSVMSRHASDIRAVGATPVCATPALVDECNDKLLSADLFERLGLRYAETVNGSDDAAIAALVKRHGFPLILKPRYGTGTIGVKLIQSDMDLKERLREHPFDYVLQEFLPVEGPTHSLTSMTELVQDQEYSLQVVFGARGNALGWFASINTLENGLPVAVRTTTIPEVRRCVAAIIDSNEGFVGPFNFQGRMSGGEIVFFEVNCRFTGITGTRAGMGFAEVDATWSSFIEGNDENLPELPAGQYAFRNLEDTFFSHAQYERFATGKRLSKD